MDPKLGKGTSYLLMMGVRIDATIEASFSFCLDRKGSMTVYGSDARPKRAFCLFLLFSFLFFSFLVCHPDMELTRMRSTAMLKIHHKPPPWS